MEKIIEQYINYTLEEGKEPDNVFQFCKKAKIKEADFYNQYANLQTTEQKFWLHTFVDTKDKLLKDKTYSTYNSSEKVLSLYFTWIITLKNYRSFILYKYQNKKIEDIKLSVLKDLKPALIEHFKSILLEAEVNNEIAERKIISGKYADALWIQTLFILQFWIKDSSKSFESTDAAIEKSVNFAFKLMGNNTLDSAIDFAKFMFQHVKK